MEEFLDRSDRLTYSTPQKEIERRWKGVRKKMEQRGIDYLVIQSQQRFTAGYLRWFTDIPSSNYNTTVIFPLDEEMILLAHGSPAPAPPFMPASWMLRGVKLVINIPSFPNVWWQDTWDGEKVVETLKPTAKTIGFVGMGNMSAALYDVIKTRMSGTNFVNASDMVDEVRMVKSEEEINLHRQAAYLHELGYEVAKKALKRGATAWDVILDIRNAQLSQGSEEQQVVMSFGPLGSPPFMQWSWGHTRVRRTFKNGDVINLLIESSGPGGYWYELGRFMCIGPIPKQLQEAYELAIHARTALAANCRTVAAPSVALAASDQVLKEGGSSPETRIVGHGQGVDLVERPLIRNEEEATLKEGMVVSLHPTAKTKTGTASVSDTYVVTDSGAVPVYRNLAEDAEIVEV